MTYSGGQRGRVKPRSERESAIQSLVNTIFPSGTGRSPMGRHTASQKYKDAVAEQIYGSLPTDYKQTEQTAGQIYGSLPIDYKTTEQQAGLEAERFRKGAGFPGQTAQVYPVQPPVTPIVTGLTPTGEVDRTQSDEYKATRARYDQLRKAGPEMVMTPEGLREKAVDYGLQEWAKANPVLAAKQEAAKYGTFNPLMQKTFGYQTGEAPDQVQRQMMIGGQSYDVDPEAIQYQIDQQRAAEMESPNPLVQQEDTANRTRYQAENATTAGMNRPIADRVKDFLRRGSSTDQFPTEFGPFFTPEQTGVKFPDPSGRIPGINPLPERRNPYEELLW